MKCLFRGGVVCMSLVRLVLFPFSGFVFVLKLSDGRLDEGAGEENSRVEQSR